MKSKIKKQYAKVLKEEGGESTRLFKGKGRSNDAEGSGDHAGDEDGEGVSGRGKDTSSVKSGKSGKSGKGSKWSKEDKSKPQERKVRALSPSDIGPPMPQHSYRELKKEAFAKYHAPSSGKGRGQPNMGARMGALLEKIKRDRV